MKKIIFIFIIFLSSCGFAANLENWDIEASLSGDVVFFKVTLEYDDYVTRSDYFMLTKLGNVHVFADNREIKCSVSEKGIGTSILCENIYAKKIVYEFVAYDLIKKSNQFKIFRYKFPVTDATDRFAVTVKLPLGAVLIEKDKLPEGLSQFEPSWGSSGSDGRRIFITWPIENPKVGDSISVSIIYEQMLDLNQVIVAAIALVIIIIMIGFTIYFRKGRIKQVLPVLTESERKVMEILLREKGEVDQRKIVKETDFSKSKVSRILQSLEARGLVERYKRGRANKIKIIHKPEKVSNNEKK